MTSLSSSSIVSPALWRRDMDTKAQQARRLNSFHNRCVKTMLGVTRYQQWKERLTTKRLSSAFGMYETIPDLIMEQQLRWLEHVGRMDEERQPKSAIWRVEEEETVKVKRCG